MTKIISIFLLMFLPFLLAAQPQKYSRIKVNGTNAILQVQKLGIEVNELNKKENFAIIEISEQDLTLLQNLNVNYQVLIPDMSSYYAKRFSSQGAAVRQSQSVSSEWPVPVNFSLGSCGGFSTVDEMLAQLDLMRQLYPQLVSVKQPVSDTVTTIEGNQVYFVRLSDNPDINEIEPEVLYTGMIHAREPIGMQHLLYYMWYLLENYESDSTVKSLVDNTEMYFIPIVNVDGYAYNILNNPDGGGMWRKNRRNNGDGTFGTDLNRNFGYKWGFDDTGSSPNTSSDTYRGPYAFSEPETRILKHFCENQEFRIALNYHSYSNLWLYAWGWNFLPAPDDAILNSFAKEMTRENGYIYGPGNTTIYPSNGGSDDWMYGEQTTKPAIFAYTPEVGNSSDGFWPTQERILPLIQENMLASITAARLAGIYGTISENAPFFIQKTSGYIPFTVKRLGMQDGTFVASIESLNNNISLLGDGKTISQLELLQTHSDSIYYELSNQIQVGDTIQYVLKLNNGSITTTDTVMRIYGYPVTIFEDKFANLNNWTGNWQYTNETYYSPPGCLTESANSNYPPNTSRQITLKTGLAFNNPLCIVLQYRARWKIENDYDYVQVSITTDNGNTWVPLKGKFTNPGSTYQPLTEPLYDGVQYDWLNEVISLNEYMGKSVKFRFSFYSDAGIQMDGFYVDDFNVSMLLDPTHVGPLTSKTELMKPPFPNPAVKQTTIQTQIPQSALPAKIEILDSKGTIVNTFEINQSPQEIIIPTHNLPKGIYFLHLSGKTISNENKKLIIY